MFSRSAKKIAMTIHPLARTRYVCILVILSLLNGCAAQKTFDEGKNLVQQDKVEQGLQKMQEAGKLDPGQIEFKTKYYQTRDTSIAGYLEKADRNIATGQYQEAVDLFVRVLGLDANNVRAQDGLNHVATEQRHDKLLVESDQLFQSGDVGKAKEQLELVLIEDPSNVKALQLQNRIAEKTIKLPLGTSLKDTYKKPITLQFRDATLKQIFEIIAQSSGLNFIFDKDVKTDQKTSIFLKDSTIESAIYYTLMTSQLDQQVMDNNTILIYPNSAAKQKDYQEIVVRSFFLTNADAKAVAATLKAIVKTRDIVIDEKLNMIIMRDSPDAIRLAEKLVALHDVAEPEVMLDVAVLEVKRTKLQDLGVQWPNSLTLTPLSPQAALLNSTSTGSFGGAGQASNPLVLTDLKHLPASSVAIGNPSATVNAHSTDGDANLLANPRIRTRNHEKAKVMIGDRVPNITVNTSPSATTYISETITYVDVGLKLDVEPTVYLDNEVGIKINLEVSNIVSQLVTKSGSVAYQIGTRNASSVLRLKDGETQVLAGLLNDEERHTINKIPALGDIPILGHLFGSTNDDLQKTEIVLSITPHVIRNIRRPDVNAAEFSSGTENNLKPRPQTSGSISVPPSDANRAVSPMPRSPKKKTETAVPDPGPSDQNATPMAAVPDLAQVSVPVPATTAVPLQGPPVHGALNLKINGQAVQHLGEMFTVQISAQSDNPVGTLPMVVGFNSMVLEAMNVQEGDFLKRGKAKTNFSSEIDPKGQIQINADAGDGSGGVSGTITTLMFRAISATGDGSIQVLSAAPTSKDGRPIGVNNNAILNVQIHDSADN